MRTLLTLFSAVLLCAEVTFAQSPTPSLRQAPTSVPAVKVNEQLSANLSETINLLEDLRAKNEATLKQQQAILEALDQLQRDAEQIRIFSKRG